MCFYQQPPRAAHCCPRAWEPGFSRILKEVKLRAGAVPATLFHTALGLAKAAPPVLRILWGLSLFHCRVEPGFGVGVEQAAELSLELLRSVGSSLTILVWQGSFPAAGFQCIGRVLSSLRDVLGLRWGVCLISGFFKIRFFYPLSCSSASFCVQHELPGPGLVSLRSLQM